MKQGVTIFLFALSIIWTIVGLLVVRVAWNEQEADYEQVTGKVSQPLALSYDLEEAYSEPRVVMAKIYLQGDKREYRLRGYLYQLNPEGMESIQVGETLRLMVKKTAMVGGFKITGSSKSASVSGIYRPNGETIIPLEKGISHAQQRRLIGFGLILMGLFVGIWTYFYFL